MSIRKRVLAGAAALALVAGAGTVAATSALASSTGCSFGDGCATLHGVNAAGNPVAMDAKYKNKNEILIGYPDNANDGATSFDGVLHFTSGGRVTTYQDTGLQVTHLDSTCRTPVSKDVAPTVSPATPAAAGTITAGGNGLAVSTGVADLSVTPGTGGALDWQGNANGTDETLIIAETYGAGCVSLWVNDVSTVGGVAAFALNPFNPVIASAGGRIREQNTGSSVDTFTDSVAGGTFTFTALPVGVSQSGGVLTADTSTAIPGTYTSVGVVYTEPGGVIDTASFTLAISGNKVTGPGTPVPYYTFVYAPAGTWTNQCVTDVSGSGALQLVACTLGKNRYQDFSALNGAGVPSQIADGVTQYHFQDVLAQISDPGSSCLTDASTLNPATPQTDATDEGFNGRQLKVDGSCTAIANLWNWNT
jgi:hypothetical protein